MKKIVVIGLLAILFTFECQAQKVFSKQNLEQASPENLDFYLKDSQQQKKTGAILSIVGPIAFGTGTILWLSAWSGGSEAMLKAGSVLIIAGTIVTLVGLPLLITGSSRVRRISIIKNTASDGIFLEMSPSIFQNNLAQNYQSGITLRLRF